MLTARKKTGNAGESIACDFLRRKGYTIVARNYRRPWGEIDVIAEMAGVIHFVEVKTVTREKPRNGVTRENTDAHVTRESHGTLPEELAHETKLAKVARTAQLYMEEQRDQREFQVDVLAIELDPHRREALCRFYEQTL